MRETISFLKEAVLHPRQIGSAIPSSPTLAQKMIDPVDSAKAKVVVEIGAGTGVFTRQLAEKLPPTAKLIVFEVSQKFCEILKKIDHPGLTVINDSAEHLRDHLYQLGIKKVDCILSGLPLNSLPKDTSEKIITAAKHSLNQTGILIQFQYLPFWLLHFRKEFTQVKIDFTFFNLPPAFIYTCVV